MPAELRLALDTNVLVYAEGFERAPEDAAKIATSQHLMRRLLEDRIRPVVAVQALAELHRFTVRRQRRSPRHATEVVRSWIVRADIVGNSTTVMDAALELSADHGLQIFDAIIVAAAVEARCDLILSEDLQDGFAWRGVIVTNPFGAAPDRRVGRLLAR